MRKVIVTGANGFIGSSLIKRLIKEKIEVTAIDISFQECRLPKSELIKEKEISLFDFEELERQIERKEYDAFYHLAWRGVNGKDKADPLIQNDNIRMTLKCAEIAHKKGCKKFLCAGTVAEQTVNSLESLNVTAGGMMYGVAKHCTHLMLETYCKTIGLPFVWMQFSNIYGPMNKTGNLISYTLGEILSKREATFGPANQPYDFIYIDDLIEAVYRLGDQKTRYTTYFIGSGTPRILSDYLNEIGELCNEKELIKIGVRPDDGIKYSEKMFDNSGLKQDIGNYISTSFRDGVEKTINSYKKECE